jgi:CheY-like chemotaxis protein
VLRAENGSVGLALAQTQHPKLILLDLTLPDIHGSEVIERLQKSPATTHIPVVVVSGDATASQIERLLVLGARNHLTKPFEPAPLLAVIDEIMQENAAVRSA